MIASDAHQPVAEFVRQNINRADVMERFGIDFCCRGKKSLAEACHERRLSVDVVRDALNEIEADPEPVQLDWLTVLLGDLIDHIIEAHHAFLRRELPRLNKLMGRVAAVHGLKHWQLHELARVFIQLETDLTAHMAKEERILFPIIRLLEEARTEHVPPLEADIIGQPISAMEDEHQHVGELLEKMRQLTDNYTTPDDACPSYRALLAGLEKLKQDLHLHMHKENNILFLRAARLERT